MKLCYIDCEANLKYIWQLAAILEIAGKEVTTFNSVVKEINLGVPNSKLDKLSLEAIEKYPLSKEVFGKFKAFLAKYIDPYNKLDKAFFVGFNARFDADFVRVWFEANGDIHFGSWFWYPPIDIMQLAAIKLMKERSELPNFKLSTVCQHFGIEFDETTAHDALYDIQKTRELWQKLSVI